MTKPESCLQVLVGQINPGLLCMCAAVSHADGVTPSPSWSKQVQQQGRLRLNSGVVHNYLK